MCVLGVIGRRAVLDDVETLELVLGRDPQHTQGLDGVHHDHRNLRTSDAHHRTADDLPISCLVPPP